MTTSWVEAKRRARALSWLVLVGGCSAGAPRGAPPSASAQPSASAAVRPVPSVDGAALAREGPWRDALAGDPLASARLAELHPASDLVGVARYDLARRKAALAAIVAADDAFVALGELAEMVVGGEDRRAVLEAVVAIARQAPVQAEPLDPSSLRSCIDALDGLSRDKAVARRDRALAVSALRAFSRAGYLDAGRITGELDR